MLVCCIAGVIFGEIVDKSERSVIDGYSHHAHVVSIEDSMHETDALPGCHHLGAADDNPSEQLLIDVCLLLVDI